MILPFVLLATIPIAVAIKIEDGGSVFYKSRRLGIGFTEFDMLKFRSMKVNAPDLRAGAALVIAGLSADGITVVDDIHYIQRGYEDFEGKLAGLGAVIEKVSSEKEIQKFTLKVS